MNEKIPEKTLEKSGGITKKKNIFYQDNTPVHKSVLTMAKLNKLKAEKLEHPHYSLDLDPSDYFLFGTLFHSWNRILRNFQKIITEIVEN